MISGADDPFHPREGKSLTWRNVNMELAGNKQGQGRALLRDVWGECPSKQCTGIMGPSGAGKTSLLNILAGRARSKGKLSINCDVRLNNYSVNPASLEVRKQIAFVAQDDSLQATSTPRECIRFSAKLRLPRSTTEHQINTLTETMIEALGLQHCADTYVGGPLLKGISGGERKRTSVGVELVTKPALIFLDEPTSGLDSFSATQVMELLHKVADAGTSVLFTIHQPNSEVFNAFDHLILLNKGRVMYQGSTSAVPTFFENCGHPMPPNFNPADWIMTVAQRIPAEQLDADGFFPVDSRTLGTALVAGKDGRDALGFSNHSGDGLESKNHHKDTRPPGFVTQTIMLYNREILNLRRDIASTAVRFGITTFLNLLFGLIFYDVGKQPNEDFSNTQSQFGALIMVTLSSMFGSAQPALFAIPQERPVFLREYSTSHYGVGAYFMSRFSIEAIITFLQMLVAQLLNFFLIGFKANFFMLLAIIYIMAMASTALAVLLGCSIDDEKMAQEFLPMLFVPQMLFAGFFVSIHLLPSWLQWVQWVCSLTYGVKLGLLAEFKDCAAGNDLAAMNCQRVLQNVDADEENTWWYWVVLVSLFASLRLLALYVLKKKASTFY